MSIAANIAEGYGRKTKRDFSQYLSVSLGSINEIIAYLDFIDIEYKLDVSRENQLYDILARRVYKFRQYLISTSDH